MPLFTSKILKLSAALSAWPDCFSFSSFVSLDLKTYDSYAVVLVFAIE